MRFPPTSALIVSALAVAPLRVVSPPEERVRVSFAVMWVLLTDLTHPSTSEAPNKPSDLLE